MARLLIVEDWIEFDGRRIARLLPNITPTLFGRLEEQLEMINEDGDDFFEFMEEYRLDEKIERMVKKLGKSNPRTRALAERMVKAGMRVISTKEK